MMAEKIVNLTFPIVCQEVEKILSSSPYNLYRSASEDSQLSLELVAYVLSRISNLYVVTDEQSPAKMELRASRTEMLKIESLIHEGLQAIVPRIMQYPPREFNHFFNEYNSERDSPRQPEYPAVQLELNTWDESVTYAQHFRFQIGNQYASCSLDRRSSA